MIIVSAVDAHTRASSSIISAWVTVSAPAPPNSTGRPSAGSSIALHASKFSQEYSAASSIAAARGAILSSANARIASRNWRCSSVRVIGLHAPSLPPMLVAQCTGSAPCELPTGLPWYFGLVLAAIWLAAVVGAVAVGRHLLQARTRPTTRR